MDSSGERRRELGTTCSRPLRASEDHLSWLRGGIQVGRGDTRACCDSEHRPFLPFFTQPLVWALLGDVLIDDHYDVSCVFAAASRNL